MQDKKQRLKEILRQKRGERFYADLLGVSKQQIKLWKQEIRDEIEITEKSGNFGSISEDINYEKGTKKVSYKSERPLTPEELKEVAGVDDINTYIARTWLKSSDNSTFWDYSVDVRYKMLDFYSTEDLQKKFKDLFPQKIEKYMGGTPVPKSKKSLMVYIGDDHCGLILKDSQYGAEHSEEIYRGRLNKVYEEILSIGQTFDYMYLVSLGDELDGYNGFTTRGGHQLGSMSNKDQFDIYVDSRRSFYDKLFTSDLADRYWLVNQNNSNHSGKGLSYMANRALEIYLECRYANVYVHQTDQMIQTIQVGNHIFGFVHGKDDSHQKNPFPLNLDAKTDAYLFEYYDNLGYSPSKQWISTIKADIHKLNLNMGKHGRYVNVPSIGSGSNWIEANYGKSQPGVLMEIVDPDNKNIVSLPIWF